MKIKKKDLLKDKRIRSLLCELDPYFYVKNVRPWYQSKFSIEVMRARNDKDPAFVIGDNIVSAVLLGSYGTDERNPTSDVDVEVVFTDEFFSENRADIDAKLRRIEGRINLGEKHVVNLWPRRRSEYVQGLKSSDPKNLEQLDGWSGLASNVLLAYMQDTGRTIAGEALLEETPRVNDIPPFEGYELVMVATRDLLKGYSLYDYNSIAKGVLRAAYGLHISRDGTPLPSYSEIFQHTNDYKRLVELAGKQKIPPKRSFMERLFPRRKQKQEAFLKQESLDEVLDFFTKAIEETKKTYNQHIGDAQAGVDRSTIMHSYIERTSKQVAEILGSRFAGVRDPRTEILRLFKDEFKTYLIGTKAEIWGHVQLFRDANARSRVQDFVRILLEDKMRAKWPPEDAAGWVDALDMLYGLEDYTSAGDNAVVALDKFPDDLDLITRAMHIFRFDRREPFGRYSITLGEKLIKIGDPSNQALGHFSIGQCFYDTAQVLCYAKKRDEEGEKLLRLAAHQFWKAISADPTFMEPHFYGMGVYWMLHHLGDKAAKDKIDELYVRAVDAMPAALAPKVVSQYLKFIIAFKEYDQALNIIKDLPSDITSGLFYAKYMVLNTVAQERNDPALERAAVESLNKALEMNPYENFANCEMARRIINSGNPTEVDKAIMYCHRALMPFKKDFDALNHLCHLYNYKKMPVAGINVFERYYSPEIVTPPWSRSRILSEAAMSYLLAGRLYNAQVCVEDSLRFDGQNERAYFARALISKRLNNYRSALEDALKAKSLMTEQARHGVDELIKDIEEGLKEDTAIQTPL